MLGHVCWNTSQAAQQQLHNISGDGDGRIPTWMDTDVTAKLKRTLTQRTLCALVVLGVCPGRALGVLYVHFICALGML